MVAEMHHPEDAYLILKNIIPTVKHSSVCHKRSVPCKIGSQELQDRYY